MADDGSISGAFTGEGDDGGAGHHSKIKKLMQPLPGLAEAAPATDINATAKLIFLSTFVSPKPLNGTLRRCYQEPSPIGNIHSKSRRD